MDTEITPRSSVKASETIGSNQFDKRRETFDKYDTVFLPSQISGEAPEEAPITPPDQGKHVNTFQRSSNYSSMRESRSEPRERNLPDNISLQSSPLDEIDYRYRSLTERTRRLSRLRSEFLASNLHEPSIVDPFSRTSLRTSLPAKARNQYKIESPNLYKFPFAEPYSTPPVSRRVFVDFGPVENNNTIKENIVTHSADKENIQFQNKTVDNRKLFEELKNRYLPPQKQINWVLPPTRPRVVSAVPKTKEEENKENIDKDNKDEELVIENDLKIIEDHDIPDANIQITANLTDKIIEELDKNGIVNENRPAEDVKQEESDTVPELRAFQRSTSRESHGKNRRLPEDNSIPALLQKISPNNSTDINAHDSDKKITNSDNDKKKLKRKRSLLDKLFNRKIK